MRIRPIAVLLAVAIALAGCSGGDGAGEQGPAFAPAPAALDPAPEPVDYDLGTAEFDVGDATQGFRVRGTIAFPPSAPDAPVALVLHMRGNPCLGGGETLPCPEGADARYDQGMGWLASALAARGYVAVVPDITETRDFRYESVMVDLGWQVGMASVERLRSDPADLGVPEAVTLSAATVSIGHSVGGDQAMWAAIRRPDAIRAGLLLEPAPSMVGMFPGPDNEYAYLYGTAQTDPIPDDLPYAVVIGRCDDDALYMGGQYTTSAATRPGRTAPAALVTLRDGDHVMLNTRAGRTTGGGFAECPRADDPDYPAYTESMRAGLAQWSADTLDVFLGRVPADGQAARRAGLFPAEDAALAGAEVVLIPAATERRTLMLPLGGALGPGVAALPADDPRSGADAGVQHAVTGLSALVCPAGGLTSKQDPERTACAVDRTERPGNGPALYLDASDGPGSWTGTLPEPAVGTVLATVSADPDLPASRVTVRAGDVERTLSSSELAVPAWDREASDRAVLRQVRLSPTQPVVDVVVEVEGGGAFLQDVFVVE